MIVRIFSKFGYKVQGSILKFPVTCPPHPPSRTPRKKKRKSPVLGNIAVAKSGTKFPFEVVVAESLPGEYRGGRIPQIKTTRQIPLWLDPVQKIPFYPGLAESRPREARGGQVL